jgi:hypothetical protein
MSEKFSNRVTDCLTTAGVFLAYAGVLLVFCLRLLRAGSDGRVGVVGATTLVIVGAGVVVLTVSLLPLLVRNWRIRGRHPGALLFTGILEGPTRAGLNSVARDRGETTFSDRGGYPWLSVLVEPNGISIWGTSARQPSQPNFYFENDSIRSLTTTRFRNVGIVETGILLTYRRSNGAIGEVTIRPASQPLLYLSGTSRRGANHILSRIAKVTNYDQIVAKC